MDLTEHIERIIGREFGEPFQIDIRERSGDQQNGIGSVRTRFDDLIFVDDEVLSQTGNRGGTGSRSQIGKATLKEWLVGEDGERRRAAGLHGGCENGGGEIRTDQPFGGRGFFELRNDGGSGGGTRAQGSCEAAGSMVLCLLLQRCPGRVLHASGQIFACTRENLIQKTL